MISQEFPQIDPVAASRWVQRWRVPAVCLVLAAIIFAVFGQTADFEFVNFDDDVYVYHNPMVGGGLSMKGLAWVFTHADCSLYHPLTMLSLMADYQLHGLDAGGYHFTNVLLHTASAILLFLILRQMTGALWRSAFVAAVFAIHPLRAESVAWIAQRKDVLGAFFFMLTLGAYVHFVRNPKSSVRYAMVAVAFVLALLSKPTVVTLPFVLLLLDYWPLQRVESAGRLVLEKVPLLVLAAGACVITMMAAGKALAADTHFSMPLRIGNALVSYAVYLRQTVWPEGLAVFYPQPEKGYALWTVALSSLVLGLITGGVLAFRRKCRWLLTGWFWYLGMLTPMIGLVQVGAFAHADRYTYLPGIGLVLAGTWAVGDWSLGWKHRRLLLGSLMAVIIGVLMFCARKQTACWEISETLWAHTLACTTSNGVAQINIGSVLLQIGKLDEGISHLQEALQINPGYAKAHNNLANAFLQKGNMAEAIVQYRMALRLKPDYAEAHYNQAVALCQEGRADDAIPEYQKALQIKPEYEEAHYAFAVVLLQKGRVDEAITHLQKALHINPGNAQAHKDLGNAFLQNGNAAEAIVHLQKALQIGPDDPGVQNDLAWLLATCSEASLRNGNKAVELAMQASAATGGENPVILHTLAAAYAEAGRFSEATKTAQHALQKAEAQPNAKLAGQLQSELKLYQAGSPFHSSAQTH